MRYLAVVLFLFLAHVANANAQVIGIDAFEAVVSTPAVVVAAPPIDVPLSPAIPEAPAVVAAQDDEELPDGEAPADETYLVARCGDELWHVPRADVEWVFALMAEQGTPCSIVDE